MFSLDNLDRPFTQAYNSTSHVYYQCECGDCDTNYNSEDLEHDVFGQRGIGGGRAEVLSAMAQDMFRPPHGALERLLGLIVYHVADTLDVYPVTVPYNAIFTLYITKMVNNTTDMVSDC